ncbi:magnesium transporter CorA family protein, partial [Candidatus Micrarchaeota archaeon]|nr:magnesium transporter CorA family protein [Candidatus Micrarchaeota archaeon]
LQKVMDNVKNKPHLLTKGHDFLAYQVFDAIVDDFFPIIEKLDDEIDEVEEKLFKTTPSQKTIQRLFQLKRQVVDVRRIIWPMRDVLNVLARRDYDYINPKTSIYFRDVYDHLLRLADMTETLRELVTNAMEGYLSITSNNLNYIMKRLTALTLILMLPTLVASAYGMNVILPLATEEFAFWEIITIMLIVTLPTLYYFKKNNWL